MNRAYSNTPLKDQVLVALRTEWPAFAAEHPHLAAVIDESVLAAQLARSIGDDPEYQQAMAQASALGLGIESVAHIVGDLIRRALRMLA